MYLNGFSHKTSPILARDQSKYVSSLLRAISLGYCMSFNTSLTLSHSLKFNTLLQKKVTELLRYSISNAQKPLKVRLSDYQIIV
jgi:hypothetical protein